MNNNNENEKSKATKEIPCHTCIYDKGAGCTWLGMCWNYNGYIHRDR